MRAILFINPKNKQARDLGNELLRELNSRKIEADCFSFKGKFKASLRSGFDLAISLGGDGTVLYAARALAPFGAPIFPVNLGTFGFIAGIQPSQWREVLGQWLRGEAVISRRLMLDIRVERRGKEVFQSSCLNDVVISASGIAKIIRLRVFYCGINRDEINKLGFYRSDGLIVSTPTGSTAYSAAAGGPVVDPELEVLIVNPICPLTFSDRPLVLPADETVLVEVEQEQRSDVLLTVDGQLTEKLKSGDRIYLKKAPYPCLLIASGRAQYYQALRKKFSWATGASAAEENRIEQDQDTGGRFVTHPAETK